MFNIEKAKQENICFLCTIDERKYFCEKTELEFFAQSDDLKNENLYLVFFKAKNVYTFLKLKDERVYKLKHEFFKNLEL